MPWNGFWESDSRNGLLFFADVDMEDKDLKIRRKEVSLKAPFLLKRSKLERYFLNKSTLKNKLNKRLTNKLQCNLNYLSAEHRFSVMFFFI